MHLNIKKKKYLLRLALHNTCYFLFKLKISAQKFVNLSQSCAFFIKRFFIFSNEWKSTKPVVFTELLLLNNKVSHESWDDGCHIQVEKRKILILRNLIPCVWTWYTFEQCFPTFFTLRFPLHRKKCHRSPKNTNNVHGPPLCNTIKEFQWI